MSLLVAAALALLSVQSVRFARSTATQADVIQSRGVLPARISATLRQLAERHSMLVESAVAERDPVRLRDVRAEVDSIEASLRREVDGAALQEPDDRAALDQAGALLPAVSAAAHAVLDLAAADVRDGRIQVAMAEYRLRGRAIKERLLAWRQSRQRILDEEVQTLRADAAEMIRWALAGGALSLAGCALGFVVMRRMLRRLRRVTLRMRRLAEGAARAGPPPVRLGDEIDDLRRASAAFRAGAIRARLQSETLRRTNLLFDGALNNMRHGLVMFDAAGRIEVINRQACEMYGLDPAVVGPGATMAELVAHGVRAGNFAGRPASDVLAEMSSLAHGRGSVSIWAAREGRTVVVTHERAPDGAWITTHEDVTERRRSEEQVRFLERHDALTGLPNRRRLDERLDSALAELRAGRPGAGFAVCCLAVRRLKAVNDTLGHAVGDAVLRQAAERIRLALREGEFLARLDGDRMVLVQGGAERPEAAAALARRVRRAMLQPYSVAGNDIVVGVSIGVALAPSDGDEAEALLRKANLALARARSEAPGAWRFFEPGMDARAQARRSLETDLRAALDKGQLEVWYQPLLSTRTRRVTAFEALARWRHPERGLVGPAEFIPVAEEIDLIVPLGAWVLRTACAQAASWPPDVKLAVNLSSAQFRDPDLVRTVTGALDAAGIPAGRLELEITESVLLEDTAETLATLHELRALGVRISMDDFGTGYSSLSYLRSFPFDKIKIDKSFVTDLSDRADSLAIVRAVAGLGRSLGMATTAEGVETDAQLARLSSEGCTEVQGFLFSPPRPAREVPALLRALSGTAGALVA